MAKRKKKHKGLWLIPLAVILLVVGGTYGFGVYYAGNHFLPNTTIDGIDASGKTVEEMDRELTALQEAPSLTVVEKEPEGAEIQEVLNLEEAASFTKQISTRSLLNEQNRYLWFTSFFHETAMTTLSQDWQMDEEKLSASMGQLYGFREENTIPPKDAYLEFDGNSFVIVPSEDGLSLKKDEAKGFLLEAAKMASATGMSETADLTSYYETARITSEDEGLHLRMQHLNAVLDKKITITFGDEEKEILQQAALLSLIQVEDLTLSVNEKAVETYVEKLAETYDYSQYEYIDQEALTAAIKEVLLEEVDSTVVAEYLLITPAEEVRREVVPETTSQTTAETTGSAESGESSGSTEISGSGGSESEETPQGETCVYVSLADQYLWYYENGELILSCPVVTGDPNGSSDSQTPTGSYIVQRMVQGATLVGSDYVEYVDYWIGFDYATGGRMLGLHDASWRSEFGGDIYLTDPSHGCVNMPTWAVAELFAHLTYGVQIVIY